MWKDEIISPPMRCNTSKGKGWLIARRYWEGSSQMPSKRPYKEFFIVKLKRNNKIVYYYERPKPYSPFLWFSWDDPADEYHPHF